MTLINTDKDQELREQLTEILDDLVRGTSPFDTTSDSGGTAVYRATDKILSLIKTHEKALLDRVLEEKINHYDFLGKSHKGFDECVPIEAVKTLQEGL